ncbi:uncharacterized protein IL334_003297 [Kwoniella shivajii]|uniref:Uncharacterized protein n=1 Tax=Kwoniella shivajii TaxID=564305 RepID=A0ABZ1D1A0_9TREE|nr:hypothetical protein IL334_003297 [Kwoniella shivajii]
MADQATDLRPANSTSISEPNEMVRHAISSHVPSEEPYGHTSNDPTALPERIMPEILHQRAKGRNTSSGSSSSSHEGSNSKPTNMKEDLQAVVVSSSMDQENVPPLPSITHWETNDVSSSSLLLDKAKIKDSSLRTPKSASRPIKRLGRDSILSTHNSNSTSTPNSTLASSVKAGLGGRGLLLREKSRDFYDVIVRGRRSEGRSRYEDGIEDDDVHIEKPTQMEEDIFITERRYQDQDQLQYDNELEPKLENMDERNLVQVHQIISLPFVELEDEENIILDHQSTLKYNDDGEYSVPKIELSPVIGEMEGLPQNYTNNEEANVLHLPDDLIKEDPYHPYTVNVENVYEDVMDPAPQQELPQLQQVALEPIAHRQELATILRPQSAIAGRSSLIHSLPASIPKEILQFPGPPTHSTLRPLLTWEPLHLRQASAPNVRSPGPPAESSSAAPPPPATYPSQVPQVPQIPYLSSFLNKGPGPAQPIVIRRLVQAKEIIESLQETMKLMEMELSRSYAGLIWTNYITDKMVPMNAYWTISYTFARLCGLFFDAPLTFAGPSRHPSPTIYTLLLDLAIAVNSPSPAFQSLEECPIMESIFYRCIRILMGPYDPVTVIRDCNATINKIDYFAPPDVLWLFAHIGEPRLLQPFLKAVRTSLWACPDTRRGISLLLLMGRLQGGQLRLGISNKEWARNQGLILESNGCKLSTSDPGGLTRVDENEINGALEYLDKKREREASEREKEFKQEFQIESSRGKKETKINGSELKSKGNKRKHEDI